MLVGPTSLITPPSAKVTQVTRGPAGTYAGPRRGAYLHAPSARLAATVMRIQRGHTARTIASPARDEVLRGSGPVGKLELEARLEQASRHDAAALEGQLGL